MFKKVSIFSLIFALSIESGIAFSKPSRKRAGSSKKRFSATAKKSKKSKNNIPEQTPEIKNEVEKQPEVIPAQTEPTSVPVPVIETKIIDNSVTNDLDAIKSVVSEEINANNNLLASINASEKQEKKESEELVRAKATLSQKIDEVRSECSGIKSNLDTIFGLSVATTVSSGLGTLAAGGALGVGIAKSVTDKKIEKNNELLAAFKKASTSGKEEDIAEFESQIDKINKLITGGEQEKLEKTSKTLGNIRTGLMAGATATSLVSTGTSIGATVTASKLAEKMSSCNTKLSELKIAKNTLIAVLEDAEQPSTIATADNILNACTGYDEANIKTLKTTMTASAVVSGIGSAVAGAGTVTSIMANTDKTRNDDSEKGQKKEKALNLTTNILAGVATGTSGASTVLSATAISRAKKDSEMAGNCESVLAQ